MVYSFVYNAISGRSSMWSYRSACGYHDINDERLYQILTDMAKENHYCFHLALRIYNLSLKKDRSSEKEIKILN